MLYIRLDGEITCHKQLDIRKNVHWLSKKKKKILWIICAFIMHVYMVWKLQDMFLYLI